MNNKYMYLGVTILNFFGSRLSTAMILVIYDIIISIRRFFLNMKNVSYINDMGLRVDDITII